MLNNYMIITYEHLRKLQRKMLKYAKKIAKGKMKLKYSDIVDLSVILDHQYWYSPKSHDDEVYLYRYDIIRNQVIPKLHKKISKGKPVDNKDINLKLTPIEFIATYNTLLNVPEDLDCMKLIFIFNQAYENIPNQVALFDDKIKLTI